MARSHAPAPNTRAAATSSRPAESKPRLTSRTFPDVSFSTAAAAMLSTNRRGSRRGNAQRPIPAQSGAMPLYPPTIRDHLVHPWFEGRLRPVSASAKFTKAETVAHYADRSAPAFEYGPP